MFKNIKCWKETLIDVNITENNVFNFVDIVQIMYGNSSYSLCIEKEKVTGNIFHCEIQMIKHSCNKGRVKLLCRLKFYSKHVNFIHFIIASFKGALNHKQD